MEKPSKSLDPEFFQKLYEENEDPWNFENSPYEREKYTETLKIIPNEMYNSVFEIGCANGVLSEQLAKKCKHLLAIDVSAVAIRNAKKRLTPFPGAEVLEMAIPKDFPTEKFDLILLSEVGYFLNIEDLVIARQKMIDALLPYGHLLLVHWTPVVDEFPLTGDEVHRVFLEAAGNDKAHPLTLLESKTKAQYRMDLFEKKEA